MLDYRCAFHAHQICALAVKRRKVEADFSGGDITSNAGIGLIAQVDWQMGLTRAVARAMADSRRKASCDHSLLSLLQQRVYGLTLGYEDLNDHDELRHDHDLALQTATSRVETLASPATLCRLEQRPAAWCTQEARSVSAANNRSGLA